jgi:hypothetical protein
MIIAATMPKTPPITTEPNVIPPDSARRDTSHHAALREGARAP